MHRGSASVCSSFFLMLIFLTLSSIVPSFLLISTAPVLRVLHRLHYLQGSKYRFLPCVFHRPQSHQGYNQLCHGAPPAHLTLVFSHSLPPGILLFLKYAFLRHHTLDWRAHLCLMMGPLQASGAGWSWREADWLNLTDITMPYHCCQNLQLIQLIPFRNPDKNMNSI